jgi:GAF domain-containing protein
MSFKLEDIKFENKDQLYKFMNVKMIGLLSTETDWLANLSNASALIWLMIEDINWAGFYLHKNEKLVLGPFQGKPACVNIEIGKGVCGTAALEKKSQLVENVHDFPGHIACDNASNSELVIPIIIGDKVVGVLDIDSPVLGRFDEEDQLGLEKIVKTLIKYVDWDVIK